jgi:voltage-gated potassium channel Kch
MTCVWTALNTADGGLIAAGLSKGDIQKGILNPINESELVSIYVTSAYFITTTMTTVGYGDIYASSYDNPKQNS